MKTKILLSILYLSTLAGYVLAQLPGFNYQAVLRSVDGEPMPNADVKIFFNLTDGPEGQVLYRESHSLTTNDLGMINTVVGTGNVEMGTFDDIVSVQNLHVKLQAEIPGEPNIVDVGFGVVGAVPYALYGEDADADPENEMQSLSVDGDSLGITNMPSVSLERFRSQWKLVGEKLQFGSINAHPDSILIRASGNARSEEGGEARIDCNGVKITGNSGAGSKANSIFMKDGVRFEVRDEFASENGNFLLQVTLSDILANENLQKLEEELVKLGVELNVMHTVVQTFFRAKEGPITGIEPFSRNDYECVNPNSNSVVKITSTKRSGEPLFAFEVIKDGRTIKKEGFCDLDGNTVISSDIGRDLQDEGQRDVPENIINFRSFNSEDGKFGAGFSVTSAQENGSVLNYGGTVGTSNHNGLTTLTGFLPGTDPTNAVNVLFNGQNLGVVSNINTESAATHSTHGANGQINTTSGTFAGAPDHGVHMVFGDAGPSPTAYMRSTASGSEVAANIITMLSAAPGRSDRDATFAAPMGGEAAAYDRGTAQMVNGEATVVCPEYFQWVADEASMTVTITPLSAESKGVAVIEKSNGGFKVKELQGGTGNYAFDYLVMCKRKGYEDFQVVRKKPEIMPDASQEILQHLPKGPMKSIRDLAQKSE